MKYQYSIYANNAFTEIKSLNEKVQSTIELINIEHHVNSTIENDSHFLNELRCYNTRLTDIISDYFSHIRSRYYSNNMNHHFQISDSLYDYLDKNLDVVNLPNDTYEHVDIVIKYINIKYIYNNIATDAYLLGQKSQYNEKYTNEQFLSILDSIFTEFYECCDDLNSIYNTDNSITNMIKYYMFQLKNISYIIEFFETINQI